jgi:hypothetical protein
LKQIQEKKFVYKKKFLTFKNTFDFNFLEDHEKEEKNSFNEKLKTFFEKD